MVTPPIFINPGVNIHPGLTLRSTSGRHFPIILGPPGDPLPACGLRRLRRQAKLTDFGLAKAEMCGMSMGSDEDIDEFHAMGKLMGQHMIVIDHI